MQFMSRVVIGGTISDVTGGKFANGAASAAFAMVVQSVAAGLGSEGNSTPNDSQLTPEEQADLAKRQSLAMDEVNAAYESGELGQGRQFPTIDGAAKEVLGILDPISQRHKVELGGFISASEDGFTYGTPIVGTQSSLPGLVNVPSSALAGFHTHPSGSRFFSIADARWVNGTNGTKIPLYLSGNGQFRACDVSSSSCSPTKANFFPYNSRNPGLQGRVVP
jgi:proteasome lid subunit RPN8/RPN11